MIRELTKKVNSDPNYKLPPGFVKYKTQGITEDYKANTNMKESNKICLEILDDLLHKALGIHCILPNVKTNNTWSVKPDIFQKEKKKEIKASFMKINEKNQFESRNYQQDISETPQAKRADPMRVRS